MSHHSPRNRATRSRRSRVLAGAAGVLGLLLAFQVWRYAAGPDGDKDCSPAAPRPAAGATTINDSSCLNPTEVSGIVTVRGVEDIRQALARARTENRRVSIAGVRHSQGGQAFASGNVVLDMRTFNAITVNEASRTVTVQSGATWHEIQKRLHPRFAVKAMQSTDIFTVGGSISVNAHGMDHQSGAVGQTIRWMRVMLADGSIRTVSRTQDAELFRLVVGGYGLFGIILDAELDVVDNAVYRSERMTLDYADFPKHFDASIRPDRAYGLLYAHLSTAPQSLFRETLLYTYREIPSPPSTRPPLSEVGAVWLRRLVLNSSKLGGPAMRVKWWAEKHVEPWLESCPAGRADGCLVTRNHPMHDSVPYLSNRLSGQTDVLQEYFVPRDRFVPFVDGLRQLVRKHRANVLNASVRVVNREDIVLSYAPADAFGVVLYVNQSTDKDGTERMAAFTRDAIDLAIASGGRFFLPYQLHYTPEQLKASYPEIEAFFRAKRAYDPDARFTNTFYNRYAPAFR